MSKYKGNELIALFKKAFQEQKSETGELLICYAEQAVLEMSKENPARFRQFLRDFGLEVSAKDLMDWWEEAE